MKKLFLILITILASTLYAKEVDLNPTDFLGIKYGSSKKEVLEQLIKMNFDIDNMTTSDEKYNPSTINIINFDLSYHSNKIDHLTFHFCEDKFTAVDLTFLNFSAIIAHELYTKLINKYNFLLEEIKAENDDVNMSFIRGNLSLGIFITECSHFKINYFTIQFFVYTK